MWIKIEERRDYELYVKNTVAKMQISSKHKAIVRKIAMQCFDDCIKHNQKDLKVEVPDG
jgi:hypothetical protein